MRQSTVEAVEALNASAKGLGRSFLRSRDGQPTATPNVKQSPTDGTENLPRVSPRKRKEQPTKTTEPNKLRRLSKAPNESTSNTASAPHHRPSVQLVKDGKRSGIYDPPGGDDEGGFEHAVALQPKKKKQKNLKGTVPRSPFKGAPAIGLPEAEVIISSSPAQATRSHDLVSKSTTAKSKQSGAGLQAQSDKEQKNIMPQAAKLAADKDNHEAQHFETSPRPRRGRFSKSSGKELDNSATNESVAAQEKPAELVGDDSEHVEEPEEGAADEARSNMASTSNKRSKRKAKFEMGDREVGKAITNVEEAISVYECEAAWQKVLVYAKKMLQPASKAHSKQIQEVIDVIKKMRSAYKQIVLRAEAGAEAGDLQEVETEIMMMTEQLEDLRAAIAAADPKVRDVAFLEQIYEHVMPRMSFMLKGILHTRYWRDRNDLSLDSLEELVGIISTTLDYWSIIESAEKRPEALENGEGEPIKRMAVQAVASLKHIKQKYSKVIDNHYVKLARNAKARKRGELAEREAGRAQAALQARLQQEAETYQQKLREDFEKRQRASRELAEKVAREERQWKVRLALATSLEAERLRNKFGLSFQGLNTRQRWPTVTDAAIDIEKFEVDSDFEPVYPPTTNPTSNGVHLARPRPRREPTEDIPAPVMEPKWTDQQIEALIWGLRIFQGRERYQNILQAPEVKGLLQGKNDLDLMQQALYIKQSMARALETGVLPDGTPLENDWSWLMSV